MKCCSVTIELLKTGYPFVLDNPIVNSYFCITRVVYYILRLLEYSTE